MGALTKKAPPGRSRAGPKSSEAPPQTDELYEHQLTRFRRLTGPPLPHSIFGGKVEARGPLRYAASHLYDVTNFRA